MFVANGATLKWIDDTNPGAGSGAGAGAGSGAGKVEVGDKEKQNWINSAKDWVNGIFGKKQSKQLTEQDILTDKLGAEFIRTWPALVANNWQLQQFLYMNKQKYYNSPLLNAIASYRTWEEGKKSGSVAGMGIVSGDTQYSVVALMAWLDKLYTLSYVYTLNLDDLSKMKLPGNDLKKDERAPEPEKQNTGGPYKTGPGKLLWVAVAVVAVVVVGVIIYFATKKTAA